MHQVVFLIEEATEGGWNARTADGSIFTQAGNLAALKQNVSEAVATHFEEDQAPVRIQFQLGKVRTSSLLACLGATYALLLEVGMLLLHFFAKQRLDVVTQVALLVALIVLSGFAWQRREVVPAIRLIGRAPLAGSQIVAVLIFLLALIGLFTWIMVRLFGL